MADTKSLTATCRCRSVHFTLTLPLAALPLKTHLCHCSICRTTHGALATFHAPLPVGVEASFIHPSTPGNMTGYIHETATSTKYFCSTCGCHIADRAKQWGEGGLWNISISIFDETEDGTEGLWVIDEHYFVPATGGGVLAALLPTIGGKELNVYETQPGGVSLPDTSPTPFLSSDGENNNLLAQCHCGGISFTISRPRPAYIASPESKGWLHPSDTSKWLASLDVCRDCRLVTGTHVIGWLFVARDHIIPSLPDNLLLGSSKAYESSEGVRRTFCSHCGATVFYTCSERPGIVDIATGILRSKDFMLDDWAFWRKSRPGAIDDGIEYDKVFTQALSSGLREWRLKTHGEVRDFGIGSAHQEADDKD
ncbi:GFA family protein [Aspergillus stella-maris]|uniref:GFA family protein n=1 Tax=Aspergillus stella-maris TaxID=1810926 RepID=UPI003CCCEF6E